MENQVEEVENYVEEQVELLKFELSDNDILVVKVNIEGLTEEEAVEKIASLREDPVLKGLEEAGKKILYTYSGIDFSLVKLEEKDKLIVYVDVNYFELEEEKEEYLNTIKEKVQSQISDHDVIVCPVDLAALSTAVEKGV